MYGSNLRRLRIGIVFVPASEEAYGCSTDVMFTIAKARGLISNNNYLDGVEQIGYLTIDGEISDSLIFNVPQNSLAHFLIW